MSCVGNFNLNSVVSFPVSVGLYGVNGRFNDVFAMKCDREDFVGVEGGR